MLLVNLSVLKAEIVGDSLARGYAGMTDAELAADINVAYRTRNRTSLSSDEMRSATNNTEFAALTAENRLLWLTFCSNGDVDPFSTANVNLVQYIFGGGSTTVSNLNTLRVESISRGEELGLGFVRGTDVKEARALA